MNRKREFVECKRKRNNKIEISMKRFLIKLLLFLFLIIRKETLTNYINGHNSNYYPFTKSNRRII